MSEARKQWESRAEKSNSSLSGVLFRGLSEQANSVLHDWHAWIIREVYLPRLPTGARVLDLGCGYGRLSKIVAMARPDIQLVGQDLAMAYCRMFHADCGPCVLASATKPPFVDESFDGVISVTCLMYVPRTELSQSFETLWSLLRPGGLLLCIDPGYELQKVVALLRGKKSDSPTGGKGFMRKEYRRLFEQSSFAVAEAGGNPFFSSSMIVPGLASSNAPQIGAVLASMGEKDRRTKGYSRLALHRWILARKTEA